MSQYQIIPMIFLALTFGACQKEGGGSRSSSNLTASDGFISQDMFKFDTTVDAAIDKTELAKRITALDWVYFQGFSKKENKLQLNDDQQKCQIKRSETTVTDNTLNILYIYDDSACFDVKDEYLNKIRVLITIKCSETDLSSYDGQGAGKFIYSSSASEFCPQDSAQETYINADYEKIGAKEKAHAIGGIMNPDGSPCRATYSEGQFHMGKCSFFQKTTKTDLETSTEVVTKLVRLETSNLQGPSGSIYYTNSESDFTINNWTGKLKYSESNISPTWTADSDQGRASGSFKGGLQNNLY